MPDKNLSPEQLLKMARLVQNKGLGEREQKEALRDFAVKNMSETQGEQLKKILGDANAVKELMNSKKAREIMERLKKNK